MMNDEIRVLMIRHAETLYNSEGCAVGPLDSPLTDAGVETSKKIGNLLSTLIPDKFVAVTSPALRCARTLDIAIAQGLEPKLRLTRVDQRLRPVDSGEFNGLSSEEISIRTGLPADRVMHDISWAFLSSQGESWGTFHARALGYFNSLAKLDCDTTLVVTHGFVGRALLTIAEHEFLTTHNLSNTTMSRSAIYEFRVAAGKRIAVTTHSV